jgi:hypothetical protein
LLWLQHIYTAKLLKNWINADMMKTIRDALRQQLYNKLTAQTNDSDAQIEIDEQTASTVVTQSVLDSKHPHLSRLKYPWQVDNSPHHSQLEDQSHNISAFPDKQHPYRSSSQHSNQQQLTSQWPEGSVIQNYLQTDVQAAHELQTQPAGCTQQTLATCMAQNSNAQQGHMTDQHVDHSAKCTTDLHYCWTNTGKKQTRLLPHCSPETAVQQPTNTTINSCWQNRQGQAVNMASNPLNLSDLLPTSQLQLTAAAQQLTLSAKASD